MGLIAVALVAAALVAAVSTFLYAAPPVKLIEREIKAAVKAETGRELSLGGPSSFRLFPTPGLVMREVTLAGIPGAQVDPLVSMKSLEANVALWPLFSGRVALDRVALVSPVFDLKVDRQGRRNWEFAASATTPRIRLAAASPAPSRSDVESPPAVLAAAAGAGESRRNSLGGLRVENGVVRYLDERTGLSQEVSAITLDAMLPALSRPLSAKGEAHWAGETLTFEGALDSLAVLFEEKPANLTFTLAGAALSGSYEGTFILSAAPALKGSVAAKGASLSRLAEWIGAGKAFSDGPFSIAGEIETLPKLVKLENAAFEFGGTSAKGSALADLGGQRPLWRADLKLDQLDLSRSRARSPNAEKADAPEPSVEASPSRDDAKVKGYARRGGWSEEPIDWSLLGAVDADIDLDIGSVIRDDFKTGAARVTVALKDRTLKATLDDVALYGGHAQGALTVDGTSRESALGATVGGEGIDAKTFLKDAAGFDWLSGKAKLSLNLSSAGGSERQIMETLKGTASLAVRDGAIAGIDAAAITRDIAKGRIADAAKKPAGQTDFNELTATFKVTAGVAENQDLRLRSPLVEATGAGKVSLAKREIDYTIRPKLALAAGADGGETPPSLEIPVRVAGPWDQPKFSPDLKGVLAEPDKAVSAIKELGKKLKGKKIGDIVRGLLGDDADGADEETPTDAPR